MPTVDISYLHPVDQKKGYIRFLNGYTSWLMNRLGLRGKNVSIALVDDARMTELNSQYRGKNQPTNVLSFSLHEGEFLPSDMMVGNELGDIIISLDTAAREAQQLRLSFEKRLAWLVTHGMLHLLGHDHERSEAEAEEMHALEKKLLEQAALYRRNRMTRLAINVDHIATVRQARGGNEPDPVTAAAICELAGAMGIVVHLREDRRHIQDRDLYLLRKTIKTKLNLEMGAEKEIVAIALDIVPDLVTLVPEKRQELTTEGGLDVLAGRKKLKKVIESLSAKSIPVSLFVDPDIRQIRASHEIGATFVEIHTGMYCNVQTDAEREYEFNLIRQAAEEANQIGLKVNAGHGLDYRNTAAVAALETIEELSIGHSIMSRAMFVGLDAAVREMLAIIRTANGLW